MTMATKAIGRSVPRRGSIPGGDDDKAAALPPPCPPARPCEDPDPLIGLDRLMQPVASQT